MAEKKRYSAVILPNEADNYYFNRYDIDMSKTAYKWAYSRNQALLLFQRAYPSCEITEMHEDPPRKDGEQLEFSDV